MKKPQTASPKIISIQNFLRWSNWKSKGTKSGQYGWCRRTFKFRNSYLHRIIIQSIPSIFHFEVQNTDLFRLKFSGPSIRGNLLCISLWINYSSIHSDLLISRIEQFEYSVVTLCYIYLFSESKNWVLNNISLQIFVLNASMYLAMLSINMTHAQYV